MLIFLGIWKVKIFDFLPFRLPSQRREKREEMIRKRGRSRRKLIKMEGPVILIPSRCNLFLLGQKCKKKTLWSMCLRFVVYSYLIFTRSPTAMFDGVKIGWRIRLLHNFVLKKKKIYRGSHVFTSEWKLGITCICKWTTVTVVWTWKFAVGTEGAHSRN